MSSYLISDFRHRGSGTVLISAFVYMLIYMLTGCSSSNVDNPVENTSRKTVMVVSISVEKSYRDLLSDSTIRHPCNSIKGYCTGSPVPGIDSVQFNGQCVPFKIINDDMCTGFEALYIADTLVSGYTGLKSVRVVTSEGTATGEVYVPAEKSTFTIPVQSSANLKTYLQLDGKTDYYEVAAWFKHTNSLYEFDIIDTIITDTIFNIPSGWFDTTRSDMIQFFVSGINGKVPLYGASSNMTGTAAGYLLSRNNAFEMFSRTVYTRNLRKKTTVINTTGFYQKTFTVPLEKRFVLQAYK